MTNNGNIEGGENVRIAELRESIRRAFPAQAYSGRVTSYDDELDDPDRDEEKYLYEALKGRKWIDVPQQIIGDLPDGYVLLTQEAFEAFVAAWLLRSLENIDREDEVRDFVIYTFSPKHDKVPDTTEYVLDRVRALNPEQRHVLHSVLAEFAARDKSTFRRKLASAGAGLLDALG